MGKLKSFQAQVQDAVEKGIATFEEQHKALADKSFDYVEKIENEAKSYSVKSVREMHNEAVNSIYETIRTFNQRVNDFASDVLAKIEKEEAAPEAKEEAPAKKPAAKKAAAKKEEAEVAEA